MLRNSNNVRLPHNSSSVWPLSPSIRLFSSSNAKLLHNSSVRLLHNSNVRLLHNSNARLLHNSNAKLLHNSNARLRRNSSAKLRHSSSGKLLHNSIKLRLNSRSTRSSVWAGVSAEFAADTLPGAFRYCAASTLISARLRTQRAGRVSPADTSFSGPSSVSGLPSTASATSTVPSCTSGFTSATEYTAT